MERAIRDKYEISDSDVAPGDGTSYFGYETLEKNDNSYYIMKTVRTGTLTVYTYAVGGQVSQEYATSWTNRATLTYYSIKIAFNSENLIAA